MKKEHLHIIHHSFRNGEDYYCFSSTDNFEGWCGDEEEPDENMKQLIKLFDIPFEEGRDDETLTVSIVTPMNELKFVKAKG